MPQKIDLVALAGLFTFGAIIGAAYILAVRKAFFYQQFAPEMAMWACGRGLVYVVDKPPALLAFLFGRQASLDCHALDLVQQTQQPGFFVQKQLYIDMLVSVFWRIFGVSYAALWPLYAVLHGTYAAGCFAWARMFFRRGLAVGLAALATLSPVAISMLFTIRDYAKAPFFMWCIVLLFLALRAARPGQAIMRVTLAGLVVGVGAGFRSDTLTLLPIGILVLLAGSDAALRRWPFRGLAMGAFVAGAIVAAHPILGLGSDGGDGTLVMQGATDPFGRFLGVRSGPYSLGWQYSDELTLSDVAAALRPGDPTWDAHEAAPAVGVSQALKRSTAYLFGWAVLFSADFATHALKALGWIAGYAALVTPSHRRLDPGGVLPSGVWFGSLLEPVYQLLGQPGLPWFGLLGLLCFLLMVFARSRRECAALAVLLLVLLTYPAIQFSVRHLFHLEILSWMGLLSLVSLPFHWRQARRAAAGFAPWALGGAAATGAVYTSLILFQDHALPSLVADLLRLPREPIATDASVDATGQAVLPIPLPANDQTLVSGPADSMDNRMPEVGNQWNVQAAADRLLITIGGPLCPPGRFALGFRYRKRADVWQPLDHDMAVTGPADPMQRTLVIATAFYRPTQYLQALVVPPDHAVCITNVARIVGHNPLPLSFSAVLPPDWTRARWHQGFGSFAIPHG